jgi:hypothetical protein
MALISIDCRKDAGLVLLHCAMQIIASDPNITAMFLVANLIVDNNLIFRPSLEFCGGFAGVATKKLKILNREKRWPGSVSRPDALPVRSCFALVGFTR